VRNPQVFENAAADNGLVDDPRHVRELYAPVPDRLRVNDDRRPQLALVEAAGLIGPHQRAELALFEFGLEGVPQRLAAVRVAAAPAAPRIALVAADENMVSEGSHQVRQPFQADNTVSSAPTCPHFG